MAQFSAADITPEVKPDSQAMGPKPSSLSVVSSRKPEVFSGSDISSTPKERTFMDAVKDAGSKFWDWTGRPIATALGVSEGTDKERGAKAREAQDALIKGILNEPARVRTEVTNALDAFVAGNPRATLHHALTAIPVVGEGINQASQEFAKGDYASGIGHTAALIAPAAAHEIPDVAPAVTNAAKAYGTAVKDVAGSAIPEGVKTAVGDAASRVKAAASGLPGSEAAGLAADAIGMVAPQVAHGVSFARRAGRLVNRFREAMAPEEAAVPGPAAGLDPVLLDGIAKGFGAKKFAKLAAEDQAKVVELAKRIGNQQPEAAPARPPMGPPEAQPPVAPSAAPSAGPEPPAPATPEAPAENITLAEMLRREYAPKEERAPVATPLSRTGEAQDVLQRPAGTNSPLRPPLRPPVAPPEAIAEPPAPNPPPPQIPEPRLISMIDRARQQAGIDARGPLRPPLAEAPPPDPVAPPAAVVPPEAVPPEPPQVAPVTQEPVPPPAPPPVTTAADLATPNRTMSNAQAEAAMLRSARTSAPAGVEVPRSMVTAAGERKSPQLRRAEITEDHVQKKGVRIAQALNESGVKVGDVRKIPLGRVSLDQIQAGARPHWDNVIDDLVAKGKLPKNEKFPNKSMAYIVKEMRRLEKEGTPPATASAEAGAAPVASATTEPAPSASGPMARPEARAAAQALADEMERNKTPGAVQSPKFNTPEPEPVEPPKPAEVPVTPKPEPVTPPAEPVATPEPATAPEPTPTSAKPSEPRFAELPEQVQKDVAESVLKSHGITDASDADIAATVQDLAKVDADHPNRSTRQNLYNVSADEGAEAAMKPYDEHVKAAVEAPKGVLQRLEAAGDESTEWLRKEGLLGSGKSLSANRLLDPEVIYHFSRSIAGDVAYGIRTVAEAAEHIVKLIKEQHGVDIPERTVQKQIKEVLADYTQKLPEKEGIQKSPLEQAIKQEGGVGERESALDRLRRAAQREDSVGAPPNKRTVLKDDKGTIAVGNIKPQDWVDRVKENLTPEELAKSRAWYSELQGFFEKNFGKESAPRMALAWLLANQNESPSGAMRNVLRVQDQIAGRPKLYKAAGLTENKVTSALKGEPVTSEFGAKLSDFVDSAMGKGERTWMGNDPRGGGPAVVDVWTNRDAGHVDQAMFNSLKERFGEKAVKDLQVSKQIGETQYKYGSRFINKLVRDLNDKGFDGGAWKPEEAQAVGWVAMQKALGKMPEFPEDIISKNSKRVSFGLDLPEGAPLRKVNGVTTIPPEHADWMLNQAADRFGVKILHQESGTGAYQTSTERSTHLQVLGSPEAVKDYMDAIGYAGQQNEVIATRPMKSGQAYSLDVLQTAGSDLSSDAGRIKFYDALKKAGAPPAMVEGFQPIEVNGKPGLRFLKFRGKFKEADIQRFEAALKRVQGFDATVETSHGPVELLSSGNDWSKNDAGQGYLEGLEKRGRREDASWLQSELRPAFEDRVRGAQAGNRGSAENRPEGSKSAPGQTPQQGPEGSVAEAPTPTGPPPSPPPAHQVLKEMEPAQARTALGLKKFVNSDRSYEILDASKAKDSTWLAGGCKILADAIESSVGGDQVVLYRAGNNHIQHYAVRIGDMYLDGDGVSTRRALLDRWKKAEGIPDVRIAKSSEAKSLGLIEKGIVSDPEASQKMADMLKEGPLGPRITKQTLKSMTPAQAKTALGLPPTTTPAQLMRAISSEISQRDLR